MDYFIKVNLAVAFFYGFYQLVLKQSVYFTANRTYLLSGLALSFIIPAFHFPGGNYLTGMVSVPAGAGAVSLDPVLITAERSVLSSPSLFQWIGFIYAVIAGIFLLRILFSAFRLLRLYRSSSIVKCEGYRLALSGKSKEPTFSIFSIIFVNSEDLKQPDKWIIRHELVHVKQLHSLDILISELVKAILWINPFAYLYQRTLRSVHEYLADAVVKPEEKSRYAELMYEYSFHNKYISLQNSFFDKTLLKRRIKMLHQKKSGKMRLAYLLTLPLLAGLAFTFSKAGNTRPAADVSAVISDLAETGISGSPRASKASLHAAQPITVSGKVMDMANSPLDGASIFLKESRIGTATDTKGRFELENVPSDAQLLFSMIGYEPHLVQLNNNSILNIRLNRKRERLDETVVVAYTSVAEKDIPAEEDTPAEEAGVPKEGEKVYSFASIEKMPAFPGGKKAIITHIAKYFRYPAEARKSNTQGTIEIGFVVDKDGNVTNPEVLKGLGKGCDEELIRVIKTFPRWEAGEQNGSKVAVHYILPVILKIGR